MAIMVTSMSTDNGENLRIAVPCTEVQDRKFIITHSLELTRGRHASVVGACSCRVRQVLAFTGNHSVLHPWAS